MYTIGIKKMAASAIFLLLLFFCPPTYGNDLSKEIALGRKIASEIESQWPIVCDPALNARVSMIFNRLLPYVTRPLPYYVKILDNDMLNAFCIPGGGVYVTSGLVDFVRSDGELAAILGHELTHGDKNHVMVQAQRSQKLSLATLAIIIATEGQAAAAMLAGVAQIAVTNGYSRDLESEADLGGVTMIWKAGYPPAASLTVLEGLMHEQMRRPYVDPGIFMTHPTLSDRISYVLQVIRDSRWPLSRKRALKILIPTVSCDSKGVTLLMDGRDIWFSPRQEDEGLFRSVSGMLDRYLELETSPHDIQVVDVSRGERTLVLSGHGIVKDPLTAELSLDGLREGIINALSEAKRKNPVAEYLN